MDGEKQRKAETVRLLSPSHRAAVAVSRTGIVERLVVTLDANP